MRCIAQKKRVETDSLLCNCGIGNYIPGMRGTYLIFDIL